MLCQQSRCFEPSAHNERPVISNHCISYAIDAGRVGTSFLLIHNPNAAIFRPAHACKENEDIRDLTLAGLVNMVQRACLISIEFTL